MTVSTEEREQKRLWVGGPAGAGKTTLCRLLARRHGVHWYSTDMRAWSHEERAVQLGLHVAGSGPGTYDRVSMIQEDLATFERVPVLIEGALLTPQNVPSSDQSIWLIPTRTEQLARLTARHPDGIHDGLLQGWAGIAKALSSATSNPRYLTVENMPVEETLAYLEQEFGELLRSGVPALDTQHRQGLVRLSNQAIYEHALAVIARGFQSGATLTRDYDCECAEPDCTRIATLSMRQAEELFDHPPGAVRTH